VGIAVLGPLTIEGNTTFSDDVIASCSQLSLYIPERWSAQALADVLWGEQ
jgi:hypothetical protein